MAKLIQSCNLGMSSQIPKGPPLISWPSKQISYRIEIIYLIRKDVCVLKVMYVRNIMTDTWRLATCAHIATCTMYVPLESVRGLCQHEQVNRGPFLQEKKKQTW